MEALEDEPVGDDVLDVVGHHRHEAGREVRAEVRVPERRERLASRRNYCGGNRTFSSAVAAVLRRRAITMPTTLSTTAPAMRISSEPLAMSGSMPKICSIQSIGEPPGVRGDAGDSSQNLISQIAISSWGSRQ